MKNNNLSYYVIPDIEVCQIVVEYGFANSPTQLPEYKEDGDIIILG